METFTQPKITGYRQLSEAEAALMNEIKAHGIALGELVAKVRAHNLAQRKACGLMILDEFRAEVDRLDVAQPERWASIGATDLQTGLMALTRAVAQPSSF